MQRTSIVWTMVAAAALMPFALDAVHAQQGGPAVATGAAEPAPRMADGRPDLSGVWWTGGDVGGRGYGGGRGRGRGAGPRPQTFSDLYTPAAAEAAFALADELRGAGVPTQLATGGAGLRGQLRQAGRLGVHYTLILGDDELAADAVTLKDMRPGGEQFTLPRAETIARLASDLAEEG